MARLFDDASSEYLVATTPITAAPLTMAGWFNTDDLTLPFSLIDITNSGAVGDRFVLSIENTTINANTNRVVAWLSALGGVRTGSDAASSYTANAWHHAAGVFTSSTSRTAFFNGVAGTEETSSKIPSGVDVVDFGRLGDSTPNWNLSGHLAECAIWNVALTVTEIAWLAKGYSPLTLIHRLKNLVVYKPLIRNVNGEMYNIGGTFTATGTNVSAHPRIVYPSRPRLYYPPAAAAASLAHSQIVIIG